MRRVVSWMILALFLVGTFTLPFNVGLVQAQSETVYVNSDGSVSPSSAPISSVDKVTYTFTGDISYPAYNGIVVERDNIVIDGNGCTVQGNESGTGLSLTDRSNVTIKNTNICGFQNGIYLNSSNIITISLNNLTANYDGICFEGSSSNTVSGNNASANEYEGIALYYSSDYNIVSGNTATANGRDGIALSNFSHYYGVHLPGCSNNTVSGNNVTANGYYGIWLEGSSNSTFSLNSATENGYDGIALYSSSNNNVVRGNDATANGQDGIDLFNAPNNVISGNNVTANRGWGIYVSSSPGNVLSGNAIRDNRNNLGVVGSALTDFANSVDTSNFVNGKPVYYVTNRSNLVINPENHPDIGYLAIINCTNMIVQGLTIANGGQGILLAGTNNSKITNNDVKSNGEGIALYYSSNNTVTGNKATANDIGIGISSFSNNNTISQNNATANGCGFSVNTSFNNISGNNATANSNIGILISGFHNIVSGNDVTENSNWGIWFLGSCYGNMVYHNNFVRNGRQALVDPNSVGNTWDDGYPSAGNYWSDYNESDLYSGSYQNETGSDGIGDAPYGIYASDTDHFPLMGSFSDFNVAQGVDVQVVSNSTVSDFQFNGTAILFNVSGMDGTTGFCIVCVPNALLNGTLTVLVNGTQVQHNLLPSLSDNQTRLYFTYGHSTEHVVIMPEFPDFLILAMFMLATLLTIAIYRRSIDLAGRFRRVRRRGFFGSPTM